MAKPAKRQRLSRLKIPNSFLFFAVVSLAWSISYVEPISWTTYTDTLFFDNVGLNNRAVELQWESSVAKVASPPVIEANVFSLMPPEPPSIDLLLVRLDRNAFLSHRAGGPMVTHYEELTENILRISMLPLVLLSGVCLSVSIVRVILRRREHRGRLKCGLCLQCGYDLRGNETGVCSECGEAIGRHVDRESK
jgi:hypothetical protein